MSESIPLVKEPVSLMPTLEQRNRLRRLRKFKDGLSRYGVMTAGMAVVFSLGLIFFYLFSEIAPLFRGASVEIVKTYTPEALHQAPEDKTEFLTLERYEEIGGNFKRSGAVSFFTVDDGKTLLSAQMPKPETAEFSVMATSTADHGLVAYGYSNGQVAVAKTEYELSYPNDKRQITPSLAFPLGDQPIQLDAQGSALKVLAIQQTSSGTLIGALTADNRLLLGVFSSSSNLITGAVMLEQEVFTLPPLPQGVTATHMQIDEGAQHLVVATDKSQIILYKIVNPSAAERKDAVVVPNGKITAMQFLVGTGSLVVGTSEGHVSQWFLVRDPHNEYHVTHVRDFESLNGAITGFAPEFARRGFWAGDDKGNIGIYFGTSQRTLLVESVSDKSINKIAISPINNRALLIDDSKNLSLLDVWNKHPEVSFSSLWQKVWYEGRDAPEYIWQASSGSDNFEAKMSFVPLSLGTLKAAFFAILFAVPLGVMGAIYTAYFMTPKLRGIVKPTIEIMAALPTVILGFLAGLWLAPFMENHLPAIFSILILLPVIMLVTGFAWSKCPENIRNKMPEGWEAVIVILPIIATVWACVALSPLAEVWFFDGSMRQWFTDNGVNYDQRNALVVGIIMGFAVIPSIFSIAEDAVFSVPRHLTQGSLALGATPWQTMVGVVLPTASPGIFSAVMMGFGRAVGETMIVLMATGNSPVVNFNIFEGMRTLSANIAVELPETAVGSTHFRVLFLAALVLLALTFVVNTLAEVIRQRLRQRYSNL
ncbi:ABC transporter permease subunit [Cellvibrio mixtus]|uniref:ABC transporter permease subunit n=1 Tax=Cellvibrio mixtus TaxID=39650 RepID=UPI000587E1BD|nr:ABC transporter permease subunit [Cellvibrio mixtus]